MSQDAENSPAPPHQTCSDGRTESETDTGIASRVPRSRVLKGAHAAFNQEFSAIPCTVRDLSETGAKLEFEGGWFVPDRFMLHVDIDGYKVNCQRLWHKGRFCGVEFIGERIRTGTARQQVIAPDNAIGAEVEDLRQMGLQMADFQETPQPVRHSASRSHGFGRRTR